MSVCSFLTLFLYHSLFFTHVLFFFLFFLVHFWYNNSTADVSHQMDPDPLQSIMDWRISSLRFRFVYKDPRLKNKTSHLSIKKKKNSNGNIPLDQLSSSSIPTSANKSCLPSFVGRLRTRHRRARAHGSYGFGCRRGERLLGYHGSDDLGFQGRGLISPAGMNKKLTWELETVVVVGEDR